MSADGTTTFSYSAAIVDSNTVAAEVAKTSAVISESLNKALGLLSMVPGQ
jgi:hypothetical protein